MANVVTLFDPADASKGKLIPIRGLVEGDEIDARMIADRLTTIKVAEAGSAIISGKNVKVYGDDGHGQLILLAELTSFNDDEYSVSLPEGEVYITGSVERFVAETAIEEYDSSKNPGIKFIGFAAKYALSKLNVKNCSALETIIAANEILEHLDITDCVELHTLELSNNAIEYIDLTHNTKVWEVVLSGNPISGELDVTNKKGLLELKIGNTQITKLDLRGTNNLASIDVSGTTLEELDLRENQYLSTFYAQSAVIGTLNISGLKELVQVTLTSARIKNFDASGCSSLAFRVNLLDVEYINISGVNQGGVTVAGEKLHTLIARDIKNISAYYSVISISPNVNVNTLSVLDITGGNFTSISVKNKGLENIIGLETSVFLQTAQIDGNNISSIDFSNNQLLKTLYLNDNPICGKQDSLISAIRSLPLQESGANANIYINAYAATTEVVTEIRNRGWKINTKN